MNLYSPGVLMALKVEQTKIYHYNYRNAKVYMNFPEEQARKAQHSVLALHILLQGHEHNFLQGLVVKR
jgi:hypothetical protein